MKLIILLLLGILDRGLSTDGCESRDDVGNIRLTYPRQSEHDGLISMCRGYRDFDEDYFVWSYISSGNGWSDQAASLACRELGLSLFGGMADSFTLSHDENVIIEPMVCNGTQSQISECLPSVDNGKWKFAMKQEVSSLVCNCSHGALRLVSGSTNREGRVEVCVDGRWETVCGEGWGDTQAGLVCRRLGFPREDATFHRYGEGSGPIYTSDCTSSTSDDSDCQWTLSSSCAHHDDAGVRCLAHKNAQDSANAANEALGTLTGLLIVTLVAVTMGWIVSCVYWWRRVRQTKDHTHKTAAGSNAQRQLDNPVYSDGTGAQLQANHYSSLGPAYEQVQDNRRRGYDVINRGGAPRPHSSMPRYVTPQQEAKSQPPFNQRDPQDYEVPASSRLSEIQNI